MRVFTVAQGTTSLEGLKASERERPSPGAGQVLVRMRAASMNFRDLAIVAGKYIRGPVTHDTIPLSEIESLATQLKKRCGSGGTVRAGVIEIQGDHRDVIVAELIKLGWPAKKSGG